MGATVILGSFLAFLEPTLKVLAERWPGRLRVVKVDAVQRDDLARQYKVLTVPTTVVFDAHGRVLGAHYGYAPPQTLEAYLRVSTSALP